MTGPKLTETNDVLLVWGRELMPQVSPVPSRIRRTRPIVGSPEARAKMQPKSRVIVVVGAGRSGTSVTTRAVSALGVELGDRLKPGTSKNAKGFFEDEPLLDINYGLRAHFGIKRSGSTVTVIHESQCEDDPVVEKLKDAAVKTIRERFADFPVWGFKSGGTIAFLPFWEDVFQRVGCQPSYVLALRNPLAVARSRAKLTPRRGSQQRSDLEWLVRNVPYLRRMSASPMVCVDFDLLMEDPRGQLERIARNLKLPSSESVRAGIGDFCENFLSPGLRHNRIEADQLDTDPDLDPLAREAYLWLRKVATDEIDIDRTSASGEWSRIEQRLSAMEPTLRYLDQVETEVLRRRFSIPGILEFLLAKSPVRFQL